MQGQALFKLSVRVLKGYAACFHDVAAFTDLATSQLRCSQLERDVQQLQAMLSEKDAKMASIQQQEVALQQQLDMHRQQLEIAKQQLAAEGRGEGRRCSRASYV